MNAGNPDRRRSRQATTHRLKVIVYRVLEVSVYAVTYVVLAAIVFMLVASLFD